MRQARVIWSSANPGWKLLGAADKSVALVWMPAGGVEVATVAAGSCSCWARICCCCWGFVAVDLRVVLT